MKIIVGLGNPEEKYKRTRHNAGFMLVDLIAKEHNTTWKQDSKLSAQVADFRYGGEKYILVKPQTYMNKSGKSVLEIINYFKLEDIGNLYVAYDDLDIKLGKYKIQFAKSPRLHNGVRSIKDYIKQDDFWNIRIGTDNRKREDKHNITGCDYVLSGFSEEELEKLDKVMSSISKELLPRRTETKFLASV